MKLSAGLMSIPPKIADKVLHLKSFRELENAQRDSLEICEWHLKRFLLSLVLFVGGIAWEGFKFVFVSRFRKFQLEWDEIELLVAGLVNFLKRMTTVDSFHWNFHSISLPSQISDFNPHQWHECFWIGIAEKTEITKLVGWCDSEIARW
jgi:hypothetical protein